MNFLAGVVRLMRTEGFITGDDDAPTTFSNTQHANTLQHAKLAIQSELTHYTAEELIPYEQESATITTVADQRVYNLESDFIRFQDDYPTLVELDSNSNATDTLLLPFPGGEEHLRRVYPRYREEAQDKANFFYSVGGTSRAIGLWYIPNRALTYRYYYQKSVRVSVEGDTLPFHREEEAEIFIEGAARRFKYYVATPEVREGLFPNGLDRDPVILQSRSTLATLLRPIKGAEAYGRRYS